MEEDKERLNTLDTLIDTIASSSTTTNNNKKNDDANKTNFNTLINIPTDLLSINNNDNDSNDIDIVISGGGLRGYYVTGASVILHKILKEKKLNIARYAGTSCGAWCAAFMAMGMKTSVWTKTYILSKEYCKKYSNKTIHDAYREYVIPWLYKTNGIPSDAYKKCTNRCFISITRLTPLPQNVIIKEYFSNDDLLECLLASSSIPFFTESNITGFYRGSRVVDGGITNNCPIFDDFADRYQLVIRLSDIPITFTNMVSANDNCIESIILRGALQMKQFFTKQGPWKETNNKSNNNNNENAIGKNETTKLHIIKSNKYELQREIELLKSKQNMEAPIFHWYLKSFHDKLNKKLKLQREFEEDMNMHEDWGCYRSNVSFVKVLFRENHITRFIVVVIWLILFTIYTKCCKLKCKDVMKHWFGCCFCCCNSNNNNKKIQSSDDANDMNNTKKKDY